MVMEMTNLGENGGRKQSTGGGGGRRKSKGSELAQKKNKQPMRGMGVAMLERHRLQDEWKQKMTEMPSLLPIPLPSFGCSPPPSMAFPPTPSPSSSSCITVANGGGVQFRHPVVASSITAPGMLFNSIGNGCGVFHGSSLLISSDQGAIGSGGHGGFRFENSRELSSIPNYIKCASDGCGICHKKKRINGGSNACSVNPFRKFYGNNNAAGEMIDAGKARRCSANQVPEVMAVRRSSLTEYDLFPGKVGGGGGGEGEELELMMRMGSTATTWCGSTTCSSVGGGGGGGMLGLRGGEGSCVTAITGGEEGSVSSLDLSLKLSY